MFIYVGKRFDAANTGTTFVGVRCDKCSCEYYYELARIGVGSGSAPYYLGTGAAAERAAKESERDLQKRLASEAELVPCPKCNWINDELVKGYRRGRYRGLGKVVLAFSTIFTVIGLLCGWAISNGPPADQRYAPNFLYGGPLLGVGFAVAMFSLRAGLRRLIRPNRNYPRAPKLPSGTPPALVVDPSSGELQPALPSQPSASASDGWLDFQIGRHLFPVVCCECLQPATTEHAFAIPVAGQLQLEIPRCAACAKKPPRSTRLGWLIFAAIGILVGGMTLAFTVLPASVSGAANCSLVVFFIGAILFVVYFGKPPGPVEAVVADQSRGVVQLWFRNPEYGQLVAQQAKEIDETRRPDFPPPNSTAIKE